MRIRWDDYIPNVKILRRADLHSIEATLANPQLRWASHVVRMHGNRIPRMVFYEELTDGTTKPGGQKLRYKDVAKRHMKAMSAFHLVPIEAYSLSGHMNILYDL